MRRKKDAHGNFYEQGFWAFYALIAGLIAGALGNMWASIAFEYLIKNNHDLAFVFSVSTLLLGVFILLFSVLFAFFFFKWRRTIQGSLP